MIDYIGCTNMDHDGYKAERRNKKDIINRLTSHLPSKRQNIYSYLLLKQIIYMYSQQKLSYTNHLNATKFATPWITSICHYKASSDNLATN